MICHAIIPAKVRSTRLPNKNYRLCAGKTLVEWAIDTAHESGIFDSVCVSSDMAPYREDIQWHVRIPLLTLDGVTVAAVVMDWLAKSNYRADAFCVLWPTTPTRTPDDLRRMFAAFKKYPTSLHSVDHYFQHDGTAIFMGTLTFLKRLSLDLILGYPTFPIVGGVDVNTLEDLQRAERTILARKEAPCTSADA